MLGQPGKGEIKLKCTEQSFPEFQNLLFGQNEADQRWFFDATHYLSKRDEPLSIQMFFTKYKYQILALCEAYDVKEDQFCLVNEEGHYLIDGAFVFLFISFVEPNFLAYMCDRTFELFAHGVAVSDTYLLSAAQSRLASEVITAINDHEKSIK